MRTIHVTLKRAVDNSYPVHVGDRLDHCAAIIRRRHPTSRYIVITDSNVHRLYGKRFLRRMSAAAPSDIVVVPAGERSKSRSMKNRIEDTILRRRADRDALIIALGGGMVGDLAGFVASTLHRGIRYVQIPTTLLAQVDSSVGGKVAVNHPQGKNLIGAFYQPEAVYIDPSTLRTLPEEEFAAGLAEVVKYGAILDSSLFATLERERNNIMRRNIATLTAIIARCCELKRRVVGKDEKESSYRRILNFGHTIGHAVESASAYRISHGYAVAIGMCEEGRVARELGVLSDRSLGRLVGLLRTFALPTEIPTRLAPEDIVRRTLRDKKFRQGAVRYTLIDRIGRGVIDVHVSAQDIRRFLGS